MTTKKKKPTAAQHAAAVKATQIKKKMAQEYGFAYAFLQHQPQLSSLFSKAVKGNWTADKFTAELKSTAWYRTHSESFRQLQLLRYSDPATYNERRAAMSSQIHDAAASMGAIIDHGKTDDLINHALAGNWNDAQIRDVLSKSVRAVNGVYLGDTGDAMDAVKQTAWKNGVRLSNVAITNWAHQVASGKMDANAIQQQVRQMALQVAPAYADQLKAGMDLSDVADPYVQSMAKTLELNPTDIDLFDPTIRKALSAKDSAGKSTSVPLWQFEDQLKADPRWLKTDNARESVNTVALKVLSDFGFKPGS